MTIEEVDKANTTVEPLGGGVDQEEGCEESSNVAATSNSNSSNCPTNSSSNDYNAAATSLHSTSTVQQVHDDNVVPKVPKSIRGLVPGGSVPGAFSIRRRARGEIPAWLQQRERSTNSDLHAEESSHDDVSPSTSPSTIEEGTTTIDVDLELQEEDDIYVAEISGIVAQDEQTILVIDGVKTSEPSDNNQYIEYYYIAGFLVVAAVIVMTATHIIPSSSSANRTSGSSSPTEPLFIAALNGTPTSSPTRSIIGGNMNWTVVEAITNYGVRPLLNKDLADFFFQDCCSRTDVNFTVFGISNQAKLLEGIPISMISKFLSPVWIAHLRDGLESYIVQGHVLTTDDMHGGMVLTSMSGYPLSIQMDPLRVQNERVSLTERNLQYRNGIIHRFDRYPNPLVPWIGKSTFDVLLETNEMRSQDLSGFIALIEATPDFKARLELVEEDMMAITLFVFTNAALAMLDPNQLADPNLLLNQHLVAGNFATKSWWMIPTGTKVSDTELVLTSVAGTVLALRTPDKYSSAVAGGVTINGNVTIVQQDAFSEQGIVHIIDKPLVPSWQT